MKKYDDVDSYIVDVDPNARPMLEKLHQKLLKMNEAKNG